MKRFWICFLTLLFLAIPALSVSASESTTFSYIISTDGDWARTQDAYMPGAIFMKGLGLSQPEDFCIRDSVAYIADTGNARVVTYNLKSGAMATIGDGLFTQPTGIFVGKTGMVYVADYKAQSVFVFNANGEAVMTLTRPTSALYGSDSPFMPHKVMADRFGNIYVVGEGSYEGMMLFDASGNFSGYFGSNRAGMTLLNYLQELFFTEEQLEQLFGRIPLTIYNATPADNDLIYSVTQSETGNSIKAHNMSGVNVLTEQGDLRDEINFVDVALTPDNEIYALTETGFVYEYDPDGSLVFSFGGQSLSTERNGLSTVACAIEVDDNSVVYVLDKERGLFQAFYPTDYALVTHKAIAALNAGDYEQSSSLWQTILKKNGISRMAHDGFARSQLFLGNNTTAEQHFYLSQNREEYSEAFWESRNDWLIANFRYFLIAILSLCALGIGLHFLKPWKRAKAVVRGSWRSTKQKHPILRDVTYVSHVIRHPLDSFYELKIRRSGSVASATILYALAFVVFTFHILFCSFIFRISDPKDTPLGTIALLYFSAILLFVTGNTLVSSINNGEGNLRRVYVMTAYALSPYIIGMPFVIGLTYALTLNEAFLIQLSTFVIEAYVLVCLIIGIRETHNYEGREIVKNMLLTFFFILLAVIAFSIVYMLWAQLVEFLKVLISEVSYRVRKT